MAVVDSVRRGDIDAFGLLVEKYQGKMLTIAYRMLGDREEACESVQEAFLAAYRALKNFRGKSLFSTWLYSITLNCAKNRMRQIRSAKLGDAVPIGNPVHTENGSVAFDIAAATPSPAEDLERKETRESVQKCLDRLPATFKEAVVLRDVNGFSYEEMSAIMHVSTGTVKSRVSRGRDMVRECLKRELAESL